jgi:hypothetical protein
MREFMLHFLLFVGSHLAFLIVALQMYAKTP